MIVFTAKNKVSGEVFVGSTRNNLEEYWGQLTAKAEENHTGDILNTIREHGIDSFELEEWGYCESPSESRELISDAQETLNAVLIKTSRPAVIAEPNIKEPEEAAPLRQSGSTQDYDEIKDLMVKIEMQRKKNRKSASQPIKKTASVKAKSPAASATANIKKHTKVVEVKSVAAKDKLPEGRVSSSAKEKRIKEAIAQEKLEREAKKAAQIAAEADEMKAIMAKLDAKTKEKAKILRRK